MLFWNFVYLLFTLLNGLSEMHVTSLLNFLKKVAECEGPRETLFTKKIIAEPNRYRLQKTRNRLC